MISNNRITISLFHYFTADETMILHSLVLSVARSSSTLVAHKSDESQTFRSQREGGAAYHQLYKHVPAGERSLVENEIFAFIFIYVY